MAVEACSSCGNVNPEGSAFCNSCGTTLASTGQGNGALPTPEVAPIHAVARKVYRRRGEDPAKGSIFVQEETKWLEMRPNGKETTRPGQIPAAFLADLEEIDADVSSYGASNPALLCPHCQNRGSVRTKNITKKIGISGAKATGAVLTGGISVLATGLSQKDQVTQAYCENCGSSWQF
jgi:hypothetical protein